MLVAWFAYLWLISGVVQSAEKYPDGKIRAQGYIKRVGFSQYHRHGAWTTYHPNGQVESQGNYHLGQKDGVWSCFDQAGHPVRTERYADGRLIEQQPTTTGSVQLERKD
jgi:antitoxin component YwqK of YwqJK toxin-antitoxin module